MLPLSIPELSDPDPILNPERKRFEILNEYLQPDSTTLPFAVAEAIDQLHPDIRPDDGTRKEHVGAYHANTWDMFMDVARQIPHDHPSMGRLVEVVVAIVCFLLVRLLALILF